MLPQYSSYILNNRGFSTSPNFVYSRRFIQSIPPVNFTDYYPSEDLFNNTNVVLVECNPNSNSDVPMLEFYETDQTSKCINPVEIAADDFNIQDGTLRDLTATEREDAVKSSIGSTFLYSTGNLNKGVRYLDNHKQFLKIMNTFLYYRGGVSRQCNYKQQQTYIRYNSDGTVDEEIIYPVVTGVSTLTSLQATHEKTVSNGVFGEYVSVERITYYEIQALYDYEDTGGTARATCTAQPIFFDREYLHTRSRTDDPINGVVEKYNTNNYTVIVEDELPDFFDLKAVEPTPELTFDGRGEWESLNEIEWKSSRAKVYNIEQLFEIYRNKRA